MSLLLTDKTGGKGETVAFPRLATLFERMLVGAAVVAYGLSSLGTVLDRVASLSTFKTDLWRGRVLDEHRRVPSG